MVPREERKRLEEELRTATFWVVGLDRINAVRGINFCADFLATPFYIKGSGYDEGALSPGSSPTLAWWMPLSAAS